MTTAAVPPAPFVNADLMQRYINGNVRIVGSLVEENAMEITIRTSDNKNVKVTRAQNGQPFGRSDVVEVVGIVTGPDTIAEVMHIDYMQPQGKQFNMPHYDKFVQIAASQQGMFA